MFLHAAVLLHYTAQCMALHFSPARGVRPDPLSSHILFEISVSDVKSGFLHRGFRFVVKEVGSVRPGEHLKRKARVNL